MTKAQQTPNIDKLEKLIYTIGKNVSISVQHYNATEDLWCVSRDIGGDSYSHGTGRTLAEALDSEHRDHIARNAKSGLPALERAAA